MSRSTLRRIRRLTADAAPVIAELERRQSEWVKSLPLLAENHLLRIIAVFQYGEPRIDEALALAYRRALSKLDTITVRILGRGPDEEIVLLLLREILEKEPPVGEIKSKISSRIGQVPDWLRYFCCASISTTLLGMEHHPLANNVRELKPTKSDRGAWPFLPQGVLEPRGNQEQHSFIQKMSLEELMSYLTILRKPDDERTRQDHRFMREMYARESSTRVRESTTESKQKEHAADNSDDGAGQ
jgi:hypothetical protein